MGKARKKLARGDEDDGGKGKGKGKKGAKKGKKKKKWAPHAALPLHTPLMQCKTQHTSCATLISSRSYLLQLMQRLLITLRSILYMLSNSTVISRITKKIS